MDLAYECPTGKTLLLRNKILRIKRQIWKDPYVIVADCSERVDKWELDIDSQNVQNLISVELDSEPAAAIV